MPFLYKYPWDGLGKVTKTLDFVQREVETHDTNDIKTSDVDQL